MGSIIEAACECGFSQVLYLGGGMANFQTVSWFPVYCRSCQSMQLANLLNSPLACKACGGTEVLSYESAELRGDAHEHEVFSWYAGQLQRPLRLSDGFYFCPTCQQMQLRFREVGCWD